jgi:uncharacterized protein
MSNPHISKIARELAVSPRQVEATVELLDEGATVPFISRYRKEMTGSLDEVAIAAIRDRMSSSANSTSAAKPCSTPSATRAS